MAVTFRNVSCPPLECFEAGAPDGAIIGVVGEDGSGKQVLLRLAAGVQQPAAGEVESTPPRRLISFGDPLNLAPAGTITLEHALARHDALVRARTVMALERLRRNGATILICSHEPDLVRQLADEVWWLDRGRLAGRGDPREVLENYQRSVAGRLAEWGRTIQQPLAPAFRRGDGRARLESIETLDADGQSTLVWRSGEPAAVRVVANYAAEVDDPVIGIMIRTRIGFEVFGTNTELENIRLGPRRAGDRVAVSFRFPCDLCPQDYTITAASHDADGVWHDWMEDAVAVSVTATRYTAGVARLRAAVAIEV